MSKQGKNTRKNRKKKLPVFPSDHDFVRAFSRGSGRKNKEERSADPDTGDGEKIHLNRHGLPFLEDIPIDDKGPASTSDENFKILLEASLKTLAPKTKPTRNPMPLKKRLKRYPPPEKKLDLHGFTSLKAHAMAKSFILSCRHQGYFTLRIVVGKGLHSELGPVLPDVVEDLLNSLQKEEVVLAFEWDRGKKSNSGAVIVYIRQFNH